MAIANKVGYKLGRLYKTINNHLQRITMKFGLPAKILITAILIGLGILFTGVLVIMLLTILVALFFKLTNTKNQYDDEFFETKEGYDWNGFYIGGMLVDDDEDI